MAKRYVYTFEVKPEGWGHFPIDMLRYDNCVPSQEIDSSRIRVSILDGRHSETIQLRGAKPPTADRWKSFGWSVRAIDRLVAA